MLQTPPRYGHSWHSMPSPGLWQRLAQHSWTVYIQADSAQPGPLNQKSKGRRSQAPRQVGTGQVLTEASFVLSSAAATLATLEMMGDTLVGP